MEETDFTKPLSKSGVTVDAQEKTLHFNGADLVHSDAFDRPLSAEFRESDPQENIELPEKSSFRSPKRAEASGVATSPKSAQASLSDLSPSAGNLCAVQSSQLHLPDEVVEGDLNSVCLDCKNGNHLESLLNMQVLQDTLVRLEGLSLESEPHDHCSVNSLADEDLLAVFKYLAPYDRLLVSEVCKRWYELSRMPWRDISSLDLSPIPGPNIGAILKHCPNVKAIFALDKAFSHNELSSFARRPLASLRLFKCSGGMINDEDEGYSVLAKGFWRLDLFPFVFSGSPPNESWEWEELALNDFCIPTTIHWVVDINGRMGSRKGEAISLHFRVTAAILPTSLKRLLLAGIRVRSMTANPHDRAPALSFDTFENIGRLQNLTCLIVISSARDAFHDNDEFVTEMQTLQNLRELYVGSVRVKAWLPLDTVVMGLLRLEVLFLSNVSFNPEKRVHRDDIDLVPLVTEHPALRILCITGWHPHEHVIPVRRLYPNGFAAQPVPLLHVILGKEAAENIVFTKSPQDALKVYPLTEPLPTFLEKEEIAPLFDGVWIVEQIKLDAKYQTNSLYDPHADNDVSIRMVDPD